jgi:hypothetical protein
VIDGAADLRDHLRTRFPNALHLTDFFHVAEHVAEALRLLFPDDETRRAAERARWLHKLKHKQGTWWRLRAWLRHEAAREHQPLAPYDRREVDKHAEYLFNQAPFLRYPKAVNDNAAIGSGVVEAACKTLVTQRLKVSGARWNRPGAAAVLHVRSLVQSARFDTAFAFHQATRPTHAAA